MKKINDFILRPARSDDAYQIYCLSKEAENGLSNIPKQLKTAKSILKETSDSFSSQKPSIYHKFLFVIEHKKRIIGLSGIKSRVGIKRPYYSFLLHENTKYPYLELIKHSVGPTELGSLFLSPHFRSQKLGRLLSLSRFLFIKSHPKFFTKTIIAELRGFFYNNSTSPVWNAIGKKFIQLPFHEADRLSIRDPSFLESMFPKKPIYIHLLKDNISQHFKQVHPNTIPALSLLTHEHFKQTNHIDIFDGGPTLECTTEHCRTIKQSKKIRLKNINSILNNNETHIISNTKYNDFRALKHSGPVTISDLEIKLGISKNEPIFIVKDRHV